ncbi:hypothetical protein DIPPA_30016 [Diplonema papillatum]|nr:hypothetical protein DIPPA_30016 [Diplonema papillatum]
MAPRAASVAGFLVGAAVGVKTASFADEARLRRTDRVSYPRGDAAAEYPDLTGHFSLMQRYKAAIPPRDELTRQPERPLQRQLRRSRSGEMVPAL